MKNNWTAKIWAVYPWILAVGGFIMIIGVAGRSDYETMSDLPLLDPPMSWQKFLTLSTLGVASLLTGASILLRRK